MPNQAKSSWLRRVLLRVLAVLLVTALTIVVLRTLMKYSGFALMKVARDAVPLELPSYPESVSEDETGEWPRNIVLVIADGMGFAHLSAARSVLHGIDGTTAWDRFPVTGWHRPHPHSRYLTDSAASATSFSTGVATHNGAIGVDVEGNPHPTLFERAAERGFRTGIVTDSYIWDATPAAFVAHTPSRGNAETILRQMADSSLEVLIGELEDLGEDGVPALDATLELLSRRFTILGPDPGSFGAFLTDGSEPVAALFAEDQINDLSSRPNLPQLARAALERLASDERPFLLLIESEEPDTASHLQDLERLLRGMEAVESVLEIVLDFAEGDRQTLVLFTSDHETGGLALGSRTNQDLQAFWASRGHTGVAVPVLALGPGSRHFSGIHTNREIGRLLGQLLTDPTSPPAAIP